MSNADEFYWTNTTGSLTLSSILTSKCPLVLYAATEAEFREAFEKQMHDRFAPKLNKLQQEVYGDRNFSRETLKDIVDNKRGCGKTTAHAMKQIAEAIQNPGKDIKLYSDHSSNSTAANKFYINDVVKPMIEKLGLKFMTIKNVEQTLKFDI